MAPHDTAKLVPRQSGLSVPEKRLLAMMPLHAITAVHGEAGLRERLLIDAGRFPGAGRGHVEAALALMSRLHAGDRRQREPYATDNAVGLFHTTGLSLPRRAGKYLPLLPVLREIVLRADTPLEEDVKRVIAGKFDKAGGRLAAVCGGPVPDWAASGGGRK